MQGPEKFIFHMTNLPNMCSTKHLQKKYTLNIVNSFGCKNSETKALHTKWSVAHFQGIGIHGANDIKP
jgi:hypothetical protein